MNNSIPNTQNPNNNTQTTSQTLLIAQQQQMAQANQAAMVTQTIQSTISNSAAITKDIQSQLVQLQAQRYQPYQPYYPPVIPSSVMQLQMMTANVGNPMPAFTIMDCKGSQFVTK